MRKRRNHILRCVDCDAYYIYISFTVGDAHSADDELTVIVQNRVELFYRVIFFNDNAHNSNSCFHNYLQKKLPHPRKRVRQYKYIFIFSRHLSLSKTLCQVQTLYTHYITLFNFCQSLFFKYNKTLTKLTSKIVASSDFGKLVSR